MSFNRPLITIATKCPKCGTIDISRNYKPSDEPHCWGQTNHKRKDEHLDYHCKRCHYEWEGDCLDAGVKR